MANSEKYPLYIYYEMLKQYPEVLLLKLSNRANTCTKLMVYSDEEMHAYVEECEKYIYPVLKIICNTLKWTEAISVHFLLFVAKGRPL